jgi:hypothetical protein
MNGFIAQTVNNKPEAALDFYGQTILFIEWGRAKWSQVNRQDRGMIFEETYLRCVRRFFFQSFMAVSNMLLWFLLPLLKKNIIAVQAHLENPGEDTSYDLDDLQEMVRDYIRDAMSSIPTADRPYHTPLDPVAISSYWLYPIAEGYSWVFLLLALHTHK